MKLVKDSISVAELRKMAKQRFGDLVKAVVDIDRGMMALDGELHSDEEALLLENGSEQKHLWGINIYPDLTGDDFIEFDSIINIRPSLGNRSRRVENDKVRAEIIKIVKNLIK